MKKISLIIFLIILNFGCEKVVEIDLDFNEKRYVIDAKINKHVSSDKAFSEVRISKSRPYFSDIIEYVNDANVKIVEKETGVEYLLKKYPLLCKRKNVKDGKYHEIRLIDQRKTLSK